MNKHSIETIILSLHTLLTAYIRAEMGLNYDNQKLKQSTKINQVFNH